MDYSQLSVSDGTGEAVMANIETDRAPTATTLDVDSVDNWPNKFIGCTGTKNANNYIDPSTMTVFYGHLDAGDIIIDGFAPGYTDNGNTAGQVVIVKPTTYWADEIVRLAKVAHENDGTLKNTALDSFLKPGDVVRMDFVASGGVVAQSAGLTGTFSDIVFYISGLRQSATGVADKAYTASKDTYVDIGTDGTVDYNEVANGAAAPALAANHIRVAKVVTDGSGITSVVQYGNDGLGNKIYNTDPSPTCEEFYTSDSQGKATRSWGTIATLTIVPSISGQLFVSANCIFGFGASARTSAFRIRINSVTIGAETDAISAEAAKWSSMSMIRQYSAPVEAGTTYTIQLQQNCTSSYADDIDVNARVVR